MNEQSVSLGGKGNICLDSAFNMSEAGTHFAVFKKNRKDAR